MTSAVNTYVCSEVVVNLVSAQMFEQVLTHSSAHFNLEHSVFQIEMPERIVSLLGFDGLNRVRIHPASRLARGGASERVTECNKGTAEA